MPKNPGIKLSFEQLGEQVQIPREFIAAMELKETVQAVPNEVEPDALSDTVYLLTDRNESDKQTRKAYVVQKAWEHHALGL